MGAVAGRSQYRDPPPRRQTPFRLPIPLVDYLNAKADEIGCSRDLLLTSIIEWWHEEHGGDTIEFPLTRRR